ncbi:MAG: metallophosphoesterase [Porphyromonadaceae bacterium]|nr:MAG: metallophosphoesterase [Porphyromonadaceae bacterium]
MLIQYASDLHLEFPENREFLKLNPLQPKGDILLLAGDIVLFAVMNEHADFFSYVSDHFQTTYWIPGNHEYYYSDAAKKSGTIHENIRSNVFLVNNVAIEQASVKFIFSTLWSRINPANQWLIERKVSDFHVIKFNGKHFTTPDFNLLHEEDLKFITAELQSTRQFKTVMVTHHVPTMMNYPAKHKGDPLNEAFGVELSGLIEDQGPDWWIYGHTHSNTPHFPIGNTQLLTNQLGYVKYKEHYEFSATNTISIDY